MTFVDFITCIAGVSAQTIPILTRTLLKIAIRQFLTTKESS
jgi:hypothetical protein